MDSLETEWYEVEIDLITIINDLQRQFWTAEADNMTRKEKILLEILENISSIVHNDKIFLTDEKYRYFYTNYMKTEEGEIRSMMKNIAGSKNIEDIMELFSIINLSWKRKLKNEQKSIPKMPKVPDGEPEERQLIKTMKDRLAIMDSKDKTNVFRRLFGRGRYTIKNKKKCSKKTTTRKRVVTTGKKKTKN